MVFLAITKNGLIDALSLAKINNDPLWSTSNAATEEAFNAMGESNLTRFNYSFTLIETEVITDALSTIQEHHPGERVWVEGSDVL